MRMNRSDLKVHVFHSVLMRLISRRDSLELYHKCWMGSGAGVEGWLRVEFVAALAEEFAGIQTGGAHRRSKAPMFDVSVEVKSTPRKEFLDLILKAEGAEFYIELKGGISRWYVGAKADHVKCLRNDAFMAFLTKSKSWPISTRQQRVLRGHDPEFQLEQVAAFENGECLCFGMIDFRCEATRNVKGSGV